MGAWTFPIFPSLESIEWRFLLYVPLAGIVYLLRSRFSRHPGLSFSLLIGVIALVEITLALTHPVNDPTNDRDRPASFKLMPLIPYSPSRARPDFLSPPSWKHLCGTDSTGRTTLPRGCSTARARRSRSASSRRAIALLVASRWAVSPVIYRGWFDIGVCRFIEIMDCFPPLLAHPRCDQSFRFAKQTCFTSWPSSA